MHQQQFMHDQNSKLHHTTSENQQQSHLSTKTKGQKRSRFLNSGKTQANQQQYHNNPNNEQNMDNYRRRMIALQNNSQTTQQQSNSIKSSAANSIHHHQLHSNESRGTSNQSSKGGTSQGHKVISKKVIHFVGGQAQSNQSNGLNFNNQKQIVGRNQAQYHVANLNNNLLYSSTSNSRPSAQNTSLKHNFNSQNSTTNAGSQIMNQTPRAHGQKGIGPTYDSSEVNQSSVTKQSSQRQSKAILASVGSNNIHQSAQINKKKPNLGYNRRQQIMDITDEANTANTQSSKQLTLDGLGEMSIDQDQDYQTLNSDNKYLIQPQQSHLIGGNNTQPLHNILASNKVPMHHLNQAQNFDSFSNSSSIHITNQNQNGAHSKKGSGKNQAAQGQLNNVFYHNSGENQKNSRKQLIPLSNKNSQQPAGGTKFKLDLKRSQNGEGQQELSVNSHQVHHGQGGNQQQLFQLTKKAQLVQDKSISTSRDRTVAGTVGAGKFFSQKKKSSQKNSQGGQQQDQLVDQYTQQHNNQNFSQKRRPIIIRKNNFVSGNGGGRQNNDYSPSQGPALTINSNQSQDRRNNNYNKLGIGSDASLSQTRQSIGGINTINSTIKSNHQTISDKQHMSITTKDPKLIKIKKSKKRLDTARKSRIQQLHGESIPQNTVGHNLNTLGNTQPISNLHTKKDSSLQPHGSNQVNLNNAIMSSNNYVTQNGGSQNITQISTNPKLHLKIQKPKNNIPRVKLENTNRSTNNQTNSGTDQRTSANLINNKSSIQNQSHQMQSTSQRGTQNSNNLIGQGVEYVGGKQMQKQNTISYETSDLNKQAITSASMNQGTSSNTIDAGLSNQYQQLNGGQNSSRITQQQHMQLQGNNNYSNLQQSQSQSQQEGGNSTTSSGAYQQKFVRRGQMFKRQTQGQASSSNNTSKNYQTSTSGAQKNLQQHQSSTNQLTNSNHEDTQNHINQASNTNEYNLIQSQKFSQALADINDTQSSQNHGAVTNPTQLAHTQQHSHSKLVQLAGPGNPGGLKKVAQQSSLLHQAATNSSNGDSGQQVVHQQNQQKMQYKSNKQLPNPLMILSTNNNAQNMLNLKVQKSNQGQGNLQKHQHNQQKMFTNASAESTTLARIESIKDLGKLNTNSAEEDDSQILLQNQDQVQQKKNNFQSTQNNQHILQQIQKENVQQQQQFQTDSQLNRKNILQQEDKDQSSVEIKEEQIQQEILVQNQSANNLNLRLNNNSSQQVEQIACQKQQSLTHRGGKQQAQNSGNQKQQMNQTAKVKLHQSSQQQNEVAPPVLDHQNTLSENQNSQNQNAYGTNAHCQAIQNKTQQVASLNTKHMLQTQQAQQKTVQANSQSKGQSSAFQRTYCNNSAANISKSVGTAFSVKSQISNPQDINHQSVVQHQLPLKARDVLRYMQSKLTDYEKKEVLEYDMCYFLGQSKSIKVDGMERQDNFNYGYDDENGDYKINMGDHIGYRYEIKEFLGKGSFGTALKCYDHKEKREIAVKVVKNKKKYYYQAGVELKILQFLRDNDPDDIMNVVHIADFVIFRKHLCLGFELLSMNLFEFLKINDFNGFDHNLIRRFAIQLLYALKYLKQFQIVHCDLKPENILLKEPNKSGIKIIDFGSSTFLDERVYTYIQSRFYRAPEIMLGIPYKCSIDMWSLGCIMAELYIGYPILPGDSENDQMSRIIEMIGVPEPDVMEISERKQKFFVNNNRLEPIMHKNSRGKYRKILGKPLDFVVGNEDPDFLDFVKKCLCWHPEKRMTPDEALKHVWVLKGLPPQVLIHHQKMHNIPTPELPPVVKQQRDKFIQEQQLEQQKQQLKANTSGSNHPHSQRGQTGNTQRSPRKHKH